MEIQINNLNKSFDGKKVLKGIDLNLKPNMSNIILGKSGCGKSVLIKLIYKLIKQDSGIITYNSKEEVDINKFAMLFQYGALFDSLKVWENIAFQFINEKLKPISQLKEEVLDIMFNLGLDSENIDKYPSELSGGMKKRVALGRALFKKPDVIFLDEPTTGLDPLNGELINDLIVKVIKEKKITAITITHDIKSALKTGDQFYYLEDGIIEVSEKCENLLKTQNSKLNNFLKGQV